MVAIAIWIYAFLLTSPPLLGWNDWQPGKECGMVIVNTKPYIYLLVGHIYGALLIIIVLYTLIFQRVVLQRKKIVDQISNLENRAKKIQALTVDTRFSKNLALVVILCTMCICPYMTVLLVAVRDKDNPTDMLDLLQFVGVLLLLSNSWMNPIVYAARVPVFKKAFKMLTRCKRGGTVHAANLM